MCKSVHRSKAALILAALITAAGLGSAQEPDISKYGFEDQSKGTMGWKHDYNEGSQAVVALSRSTKEKLYGQASLQIDLQLNSQDALLSSGEAAVHVVFDPIGGPAGVMGRPIDLSTSNITGYIKFPADFPVDKDNPHGVQIFLKDQAQRNFYGCWENIRRGGLWMPISISLNTQPPKECGAVRDEGFDLSRIEVIGVKIGANPNADIGSATYTGPCYLDSIDF